MFSKISAPLVFAISAGSFVALGHPTTSNNVGRDVDAYALSSVSDEADANFPGCDTTQQATLQRAIDVAIRFQRKTHAYFRLLGPNPPANADLALYTTWFGVYDHARYTTVYNRFLHVDTYPLNSWTYYCRPVLSPGRCGALAQFATNAISGSGELDDDTNIAPVEICKGFWLRDAIRKNDTINGQTIFHEATHFHHIDATPTVVMGTNHGLDEDYGESFCEGLARDHPADACRNADSYAFFAQYVDKVIRESRQMRMSNGLNAISAIRGIPHF
ncbi:hypothetical protein BDN71DRAFT_999053 [Pleurotus eryngii]|uniref:Lysine-specific metallo-endopeptidase domain-containing protein n=1 Tax=Pleurotus eryngii TaxID=5323 RepID=A0A9P6DFU9_PLEER|nr:hypothetical protein BDN71DRAFT_999053 [Pleurotus eryngii]